MTTSIYHKTHSFIEVSTGKTCIGTTQLYETGIYVICNNDPTMQFVLSIQDMVDFERNLRGLESKGEIKNLTFGSTVHVVKVDGFLKQIQPTWEKH